MATFTATRAASNQPPRLDEKGMFCEVSTYTFLGTETAGAVILMANIATGATLLDASVVNSANTASFTAALGDTTNGATYWFGQTAMTSAAKTRTIAAPKTYNTVQASMPAGAADQLKLTTAGATATAGATVTVIAHFTMDPVTLA